MNKPLVPIYAFDEINHPIALYTGPIGGLVVGDVPGTVELSWTPKPSLNWSAGPFTPSGRTNRGEATLRLWRPGGNMELPAWVRGTDIEWGTGYASGSGWSNGWSNGAVFGNQTASLERIIAHWFNLPDWHGPIPLTDTTADGNTREWSGRLVIDSGSWQVTIDVRPDHARVWRDLHKMDTYVMTHVMELRRTDGGSFTAAEAEPVITALHFGISFALGRWAAPMLPVGLDLDGNTVWERWAADFCDPARRPSPGWWYEQDHQSLAALLRLVIAASSDSDALSRLRLQTMLAIAAMGYDGFIEQRIMSGAAGLEHVLWQVLVLSGRMTKKQFNGYDEFEGRKLAGHDRLRMALKDADIPTDINPAFLPVTAQYAEQMKADQGLELDGAGIVTWTRNRLVHPEGTQEPVYRRKGLLVEVWLLTRHYLVLLLLHSLGYHDAYRDLRRREGWAGNTEKVPWAK